jgi:hypothetical protein
MRKSNQKNNNSKEQGVALLFVILLTSVLLLVALGIANVSYKELTFSLEARDSDKAFFAADTGIECALYLDKENFFDGSIHPFECAGATLIVPATTSPFQFVVPLGIECAEITVDKLYNPDGLSDGTLAHPFYTKISSVGYNANRVSILL